MGRDRTGFTLSRIYDDATPGGYRVLVDRLWPRGVSKERAALDEWLKEVAPSSELRTWYGHQPERFDRFAARYREELGRPPARAEVERLRHIAREREVVLLTATRDIDRSGAKVLSEHLAGR